MAAARDSDSESDSGAAAGAAAAATGAAEAAQRGATRADLGPAATTFPGSLPPRQPGPDSHVTDTRADSADGAAWGTGYDCPDFAPGKLTIY